MAVFLLSTTLISALTTAQAPLVEALMYGDIAVTGVVLGTLRIIDAVQQTAAS
ncbi:hypothetical protein [Desulfurococcus sp.]|uniref:hypothetical protein n=1 Tax=Desulfurococcus sp. TaxID=51678 RepID=UPI003160B25D